MVPGTNPSFVVGFVPTAAQWNAYFENKFDGLLSSYNELRTSVTNPLYANLAGGAAPWDNAGGLFFFVAGDTTTPDDGGTCIVNVNTGGRFFRLFGGAVNPQWWGSKGNGSHDDSDAVQNCINAGIATGAGVLVPVGLYNISRTMLFTDVNDSRGFKFEGAFLGRDGDGVSFRMLGSGHAAIFEITPNTGLGMLNWQFKNFRLETQVAHGATAGMLWSSTQFSQHFVEKVYIGMADGGTGGPTNAFQIAEGTGANGEFIHFLDCGTEAVDVAFLSNAGQAYMQQFDRFVCGVNPGGTMFSLPTGGGGLIVTGLEGGASQLNGCSNSVVVRTNSQGSAVKFLGGRIEHITCLAVIGDGGGSVSFESMDVTMDLDPTNSACTTLYAVQAFNPTGIVTFENMLFSGNNNNCTFPIQAQGAFTQTWHMTFKKCLWSSFARPPYGALLSPGPNFQLLFKHCLVGIGNKANPITAYVRFDRDLSAGEFVPGARSVEGDSAWSLAGLPDQQITNPQISNTNGSAITPLAPWVASSPGTIQCNDWNGAGGQTPNSSSPFARSIVLAAGQKLAQTMTAIDLSSSAIARYQISNQFYSTLTWQMFVRFLGTNTAFNANTAITFTISESLGGSIIDSVSYMPSGSDTQLITVSATFLKAAAPTNPVITIQAGSAGTAVINLDWQLFSTYPHPSFAPVTTPTTYTTDISQSTQSLSVWDRLMLPYKSDTSGSASTRALPNLVSDFYRSSTDGRLTSWLPLAAGGAGAWGKTPNTFFAAAQPTTGTWNLTDIVYNSAPGVGKPVGWECIVAGTPGTWAMIGTLAGATDYPVPTTGGTVTITARTTIIDPAADLAALTIVFPPTPTDEQVITVSSPRNVTTLTLTLGGKSIKNAATFIQADTPFSYRYRASNSTWYTT